MRYRVKLYSFCAALLMAAAARADAPYADAPRQEKDDRGSLSMSAAAETDDSNAPSIATRDCVCYESSGSASGEPELIVKMVTTEPTDPFLQQTWDAP